MSARQIGTIPEASRQEAAASRSEGRMARQCECGNHTFGANECDACRDHTPSGRGDFSARRGTGPPDAPPQPAGTPARSGLSFGRVRATVNITDTDPQRARITADLITKLAAQLGIPLADIDIRADAEARRRTEARSARGLNDGKLILLHPDRFDPRSASGRYLLAHETAHLAQRGNRLPGSGARILPLARRHAELEAHTLGENFAEGRLVERVRAAMPGDLVAADTDVEEATPPKTADTATSPEDRLNGAVARNHPGELARIHGLLSYSLFDWAITDEDVRKVLTILQAFSLVAARSLVRALTDTDRDRLLDNLDTTHYERQRPQVLAVYWGCRRDELRKYSGELKKAFSKMELRQLDPLEALAANYALDALDTASRAELLAGPKGPVIKEILSVTADKTTRDDLAARELDEITKAQKEEDDADADRAAAENEKTYSTPEGERSLDDLVTWIRKTLDKFWVRDRDAIAILDALAPLANQPLKLRAVADRLSGVYPATTPPGRERSPNLSYNKDQDYLKKLIDEIPVPSLYESGERRRAFFRLLTFRPAYQNEELAEELVDTPWYSVVTSEDAYLAYQLVRAMPERARKAFYDSHGGENWKMVLSKLSPEMRKSEELNLYTGGKDEKDRQSIQTQLLDDTLWSPGNTVYLEALIRMAIAAGEHRFVFEQSEHRAAYQKPWLKEIVEKFMLFDPSGKDPQGNPRSGYNPEILKGTPWYREGFLGKVERGVSTLVQFIDFIVSSDRVSIATQSIGGRGLNLAELQDLTGGSLGGVELSRQEALGEEGRKAREQKKGVNFADVRWDLGAGILEVDAKHLEFAAIRAPLEDLTLEATGGTVRNFHLRLKYAINDKPEPSGIIAELGQLSLKDVLLVQPDSMKGAKSVDLNGLMLTAGKAGAEKAIEDDVRARHGRKTGIPVFDPLFGAVANIISLTGFEPFGLTIVKSSVDELQEVAKPRVPMQFEVSFDSLRLTGITTSAGQFIESFELADFAARGGGDPKAYRKALEASQLRLSARLSQQEKSEALASDPDEKARHQGAVVQLRKQLEHVIIELKALDRDEADAAFLENLQKTSPAEFARNPANQSRLRKLKARLAGSTLDVGKVSLRGIGGITNDTLSLTDVHGQGRSSVLALDTLTSPDKITGFILGEAGRPAVKGLPSDQVTFALDIGQIDLPNIRLKGAIPDAKTAKEDFDRFDKHYDPWRPSHQKEHERLELRKQKAAQREALLIKGISHFTKEDSRQFAQLTAELDRLEDEAAGSIGRLVLEGTSVGFGAGGTFITNADDLLATDVKFGSTHIQSIRGTEVQITLDVGRDLANLVDWRKQLKTLGIRGKNVTATGIQLPDSGLEIDRASLLGLDDASLARNAGESTAHLKTQLVLVEGIRLRNMEGMLIAERDHLRSLANPQAQQLKRLAAVESKLAAKEKLAQALTQAELKVAKARNPKAIQAAQAIRDRAQADLDRWAEGFIAERLAIEGVDIDVTGLGDVLSEHYDPTAAMATGITIQGRGGTDKRRTFEKATLTNASAPGLSNATLTVGETSGEVTTSDAGTRFKDVHLDSIAIDGFDWRDGARHAFSRGTSQILGVNVTAFVADDQIIVSRLSVDAILADQLGYEDDQSGMSVSVESGGLGGITATNLTVKLPQKDAEGVRIAQGQVDVARVEDLRFNALVSGIRAKGKLVGTGLHAEFVTDRKAIFRLEDLSLQQGQISRRSDLIHVEFRHLLGAVTREALEDGSTKYTLSGIALEEIDVGKSRWSDGTRTIEVNGAASLKGITLDAEIVQGNEKEHGHLKKIQIIRLNVDRIEATDLGLHGALEPPDPAKAADGPRVGDYRLESGVILGLELAGPDFALPFDKMVGTASVKDSIDLQNLRIQISENGKQTLKAAVSVKAHGRQSSNEGLRGRELRATFLGPKGQRYELGTIEKITGDVETGGAKSGFATGLVTMSPVEVSADGHEIKVADVGVKDLELTNTTYKDGKGTEIQLDSAHVDAIHLQSLVARFGEVTDAAGKKTQGVTDLTLAGLKFDLINAKGLHYTGKATISSTETSELKLSADTAQLKDLELTSLSHDFSRRVRKLDARLAHTSVTGFVLDFGQALKGADARVHLTSNIEAGAMHAELTLTGTRSGVKDWTAYDGYFELTDPALGLGLTNVNLTYDRNDPARKEHTAVSLLTQKTGGFKLTGLKVRFAPNGTLYVPFDELSAEKFTVTVNGVPVEIDLARLRGGAVALQNKPLEEALDLLGATVRELEVSGVKVTYTVDRGAPSTAGAGGAGAVWKVDPLRKLNGNITIKGHAGVDFEVPVPIVNGVIDFDKVKAETHGVNVAPLGIDHEGVYYEVLRRTHIAGTAGLPGAQEEVKTEKYILSRGSLNLATLIEAKLNEAPATTASTAAPEPLTDLNTIRIESTDLQLGQGDIRQGSTSATLPPASSGKNIITISGVSVGSDLQVSIPEFLATRSDFELLGKKGETGQIEANMKVSIEKLGSAADPVTGKLTFTITLTIDSGRVANIKFGNASLVDPGKLRGLPGPPTGGKP